MRASCFLGLLPVFARYCLTEDISLPFDVTVCLHFPNPPLKKKSTFLAHNFNFFFFNIFDDFVKCMYFCSGPGSGTEKVETISGLFSRSNFA